MIDSIQLAEQYPVVTPSEWEFGDDVVIVPELTTSLHETHFPEGLERGRALYPGHPPTAEEAEEDARKSPDSYSPSIPVRFSRSRISLPGLK